MEAAMPLKASVQPARPRNVLVFSLALGFQHASIPHGEKAFEILGKKTGAYTATLSRDLRSFEPESLAKFDAVIFNNTTGELFTTPTLRTGLINFVRGGKGVIGIHSASDACYGWQTYGDMMGGYFNGHPWNADSTVTLKIDAPKHPAAAAFAGRPFTVVDEIYQFKEPYSRMAVRVLTSLDVTKTDMNKKSLARPDNDFPVSWVQDFGKGRVFYCSLGHNKEIFWNSTVLQHYLDGIQYAVGDLKADGSPKPREATAALRDSLPHVIGSLADYEVEQNHRGAGMVQMYIRQTARLREARRHLAHELSQFAAATGENTSHTLAGRQFACRCLSNLGNDADAAALAPMLNDQDVRVADMARLVLERVPGKAPGNALIPALQKSSGPAQIGIINTLGQRREGNAVALLAQRIGDSNPAVAEAAATALGNIGTRAAAEVLLSAIKKSSAPLRTAIEQAAVRAAERLASSGETQRAQAIYNKILKSDPPGPARLAAFNGLASLPGNSARELILDTVSGADPGLQSVAIGTLLRPKAAVSTAQILNRLARTSDELRPVFLDVLAQRGDSAALPAVLKFTDPGTTETVRAAALRALAQLGDRSVVQLLANTAATQTGSLREAARASLSTLKPTEVDEEIAALLQRHTDAAKAEADAVHLELIRAAGDRRVVAAAPALLGAAKVSDDKLRSAALKAISDIGDATRAPDVAALLSEIKSDRVRTEAEQALLALVRKTSDDQKNQADVILGLLNKAGDAPSSASLLRVAGNIADDRTLSLIRHAQSSASEQVIRDAATRALIEYPDAAPIEDVLQLARSGDNEIYRTLALRGFARMLGVPADRDTSKTMQYCEEALKLASTPDDKRMVLGALADVTQPGVLQLVMPYIEDPELKHEAQVSALKLAENSWAFLPDEATSAAQLVIDTTDSDARRKDARKVVRDIRLTSDTITGWQVAGPFLDEDTTSLLDIMEHAFAPETQAEGTSWKPIAVSNLIDEREAVDLLKALGGNDRAAYLRVKIWSPAGQHARLEIGSDDAVRAWLNGKIVHATTEPRGYHRASDKVDVALNEGWNYLMLKIGQTSGDWKASARVVSPSGGPIPELKYNALDSSGTYVNDAS